MITIEDEVLFGPKSLIVASNHGRKDASFRYGHQQLHLSRLDLAHGLAGTVLYWQELKLEKVALLRQML